MFKVLITGMIAVDLCNSQIAIRNNQIRKMSKEIRSLNNHIDLLLHQEKQRRFNVNAKKLPNLDPKHR